jgi:hypothetical protein
MIQERYRSDYPGEFVILQTRLENGKKVQDREWVPNPVENNHVSGRAAVLIDRIKSNYFKESHLENHAGGHLGKYKLQTYGTEKSWFALQLDLAVINEITVLDSMIDSNYQETTTVYTNSRNCIKRQGEFYLLPYNVKTPSTAASIYLAAFDEHNEIFICGADGYGPDNYPSQKILDAVSEVFRCYSNTTFYFILNKERSLPEQWRKFKNVKIMNHRKFVSYCDL